MAFSIIELMIAVAILGIALSIALPNIQYMLLNNAIVSKTNELVGVLNYARSEAITRFKPVIIRRHNQGWGAGWQLEVNGSTLKRITYNDNIIITANPELDKVEFNRKGRLEGTVPIFTICVKERKDNEPAGRQLQLSPMGRVSLINSNAECR
jgi:type IV fimbrial biogenesis protein FimT